MALNIKDPETEKLAARAKGAPRVPGRPARSHGGADPISRRGGLAVRAVRGDDFTKT